jgi:hypothetical protein
MDAIVPSVKVTSVGSLFNMIVVTDVTLTLYYRVHGSLFNMIVFTDVTLTL